MGVITPLSRGGGGTRIGLGVGLGVASGVGVGVGTAATGALATKRSLGGSIRVRAADSTNVSSTRGTPRRKVAIWGVSPVVVSSPSGVLTPSKAV